MGDTGQYRPTRGSIAAQLIGDMETKQRMHPLQQCTKAALGRALVPTVLDKDIHHLPLLIDRTPQVMALPTHRDKQFIEMPYVPQPPLAMPQLSRKLLSTFPTP